MSTSIGIFVSRRSVRLARTTSPGDEDVITLYSATTPNGRKISIFPAEAGIPCAVFESGRS